MFGDFSLLWGLFFFFFAFIKNWYHARNGINKAIDDKKTVPCTLYMLHTTWRLILASVCMHSREKWLILIDNTEIQCLNVIITITTTIIIAALNQLYSLKVAACILAIIKDWEDITEYF